MTATPSMCSSGYCFSTMQLRIAIRIEITPLFSSVQNMNWFGLLPINLSHKVHRAMKFAQVRQQKDSLAKMINSPDKFTFQLRKYINFKKDILSYSPKIFVACSHTNLH